MAQNNEMGYLWPEWHASRMRVSPGYGSGLSSVLGWLGPPSVYSTATQPALVLLWRADPPSQKKIHFFFFLPESGFSCPACERVYGRERAYGLCVCEV